MSDDECTCEVFNVGVRPFPPTVPHIMCPKCRRAYEWKKYSPITMTSKTAKWALRKVLKAKRFVVK